MIFNLYINTIERRIYHG